MLRKTMMALAGSTALLIAAPVVAAPGGGGGGGGHGGGIGGVGGAGGMVGAGGPAGMPGSTASLHSQGLLNASPIGISHASPNSVLSGGGTTTTTTGKTQATTTSQGLQHASPDAISRANANSVLARSGVPTTSLTGIATGQTVNTASGSLGTISRIIYGPGQSTIRAIVVTTTTGQTYTLPANSLSISGGVVTTTTTIR